MSRQIQLLRISKISQLNNSRPGIRNSNNGYDSNNSNEVDFTLRGKHYPNYQLIANKLQTLKNGEWGLKSDIPTKIQIKNTNTNKSGNKYRTDSRFMVMSKLDSQERMTHFEKVGGIYWNRMRFKEMGIVPSYSNMFNNKLSIKKVNNNTIDYTNYRTTIFESRQNLPWIDYKKYNENTNRECNSKRNTNDKNNNNKKIQFQANESETEITMISRMLDLPIKSNGKIKTENLLKIKNQLQNYRHEFKQWLIENEPNLLKQHKINPLEFKDRAMKFLLLKSGKKRDDVKDDSEYASWMQRNKKDIAKQLKNNQTKIIGTGGLSYKAQGKLFKTPLGYIEKNIVPGRILTTINQINYGNNFSKYNYLGNNNVKNSAIGGFYAKSDVTNVSKMNLNVDNFIREKIMPFHINNMIMDKDGKIIMIGSVVSIDIDNSSLNHNNNDTLDNNMIGNGYTSYSNNKSAQFNNSKKSDKSRRDAINDLLFTLENSGKNQN